MFSWTIFRFSIADFSLTTFEASCGLANKKLFNPTKFVVRLGDKCFADYNIFLGWILSKCNIDFLTFTFGSWVWNLQIIKESESCSKLTQSCKNCNRKITVVNKIVFKNHLILKKAVKDQNIQLNSMEFNLLAKLFAKFS